MNHNSKYVSFDLLRGVAALLVCIGHIRNFLFVDFGNVLNPNFFDKLFYFLTGLGHQAVMIFFVMSGYLVGGSVWKNIEKGNFSWGDYAVTRLTRLWLVLIPALAVTFILDTLGKYVANGAGYDGKWLELLSSGPGIGINTIDLSILALLGNILFLQTIAVPVYGSNGPLWSLANEFWYYLIFPCIALALYKSTLRVWLVFAALIGLYFWFPVTLFVGFIFWVMGCLVAIAAVRVVGRINWWHVIGSAALFVAAMASAKFFTGFGSDLIVAVASALLLLVLPSIQISNWVVVRTASMLSEMSYSLYLFHFPFVAFFWFVFIAPIQLQPNSSSYINFFILSIAAIIFCFVMWWLFERHTISLRTVLINKLKLASLQ